MILLGKTSSKTSYIYIALEEPNTGIIQGLGEKKERKDSSFCAKGFSGDNATVALGSR